MLDKAPFKGAQHEVLPKPVQGALAAKLQVRALEAGKTLFRQGDPFHSNEVALFGLAEGSAKIELATAQEGSYVIHIMRPGDWYGIAASLGNQNRWATPIILERSTVATLSRGALNELTKSHPVVWQWLSMILRSNIMRALSRTEALMIRDPDDRIAAVLMQLRGAQPLPVVLPISQEELAIMANASVHTVRKCLKSREEAGELLREYGRITLLAPECIRA